MLTIAIGTENPAKIKAIQAGIAKISQIATLLANQEIAYITKKVETWVPEMPLTQEHIDQGAKNRAENLIKLWVQADFYIGLEWGCYQQGSDGFLTGSVYITNKKQWYLGKAPSIQMPKNITKELFENGKNLGKLMDEITQWQEISKKNWAFGVLSSDLITRDKSFETATLLALNPFFNHYYQ